MFLDYLRKQAMLYSTNVHKEVKLLDEGGIYKNIMNMNPIFIKPKTGTRNIIEVVLVKGKI
jgi:hypothetical protein